MPEPGHPEAAPTTRRRRPQWRGERRAVLVRLPAPLADRLRAEAERRRESLSDTAASLINAGITGRAGR